MTDVLPFRVRVFAFVFLVSVSRFRIRLLSRVPIRLAVSNAPPRPIPYSGREQCGPPDGAQFPAQHLVPHRPAPAKIKCVEFALRHDAAEETDISMKYCSGGYAGTQSADAIHKYHEQMVAYMTTHPVRAKRNVSTYFDIGSNSGIFSVIAAHMGFSVYSFEPQPVCADNILHMIAENQKRLDGRQQTWKVFNTALGCKAGKIFVYGSKCGMNWQNLKRTGAGQKRDYPVDVAYLSALEPLLRRAQAAPLLKVDTDGGDLMIAASLVQLLQRGLPFLPEMYFEINPAHWHKVTGCDSCTTGENGYKRGRIQTNSCCGKRMRLGQDTFTALGSYYKEIYFFANDGESCESTGVTKNMTLHKRLVPRNNQIFRVGNFTALLDHCINLRLEDHRHSQMNVWFAA
jgi:FkbM family methyltransferase